MLGVDAVIVAHVVAVVAVGRRIERLQPHTGHAEAGEVVEPAPQPLEVTAAVPVRVHVLLDVETVDDRVLVPEILDRHARASRWRTCRTGGCPRSRSRGGTSARAARSCRG